MQEPVGVIKRKLVKTSSDRFYVRLRFYGSGEDEGSRRTRLTQPKIAREEN